MQLNKAFTPAIAQIRSYAPGKLVVNDQPFEKSIIITPEKLIEDWPPQTIADLTTESFEQLLKIHSKLVIFGTGEQQHFPKAALYANCLQAGKTLEFMNTQAACHTFTILQSEGRDVACALLIR